MLQAFLQDLGVAHEFGSHHELLGSGVGLVNGVLLDDVPGSRRHHHHSIGEEHGFVDGVRDKDDGEFFLGPQGQQIGIKAVSRDFIQGPKRLVHQQQVRLGDQATGDGDPHLHAS